MKQETEREGTEARILESARKLFTKNGFAATKTRDIAADAGINLALLNYYFRSKENLFQLVMEEKMAMFLGVIGSVVNNESTSLNEKIRDLALNYSTLLQKEKDMPLFIINSMHANPKKLFAKMNARLHIRESVLMRQLVSECPPHIKPLDIMINVLSMILFPFLARPLIQQVGNLNASEFDAMLDHRKHEIPKWMDHIMSHNHKHK